MNGPKDRQENSATGVQDQEEQAHEILYLNGSLNQKIVAPVLEQSAGEFTTQPFKSDDPAICREILACKSYGAGGTNQLDPLASRAHPNERLIRAFNIDNAFTTFEDAYGKEFRTTARDSIKNPDWNNVVSKSMTAASKYIKSPGEATQTIDLGALVRSVSLQVTLYVFFGLDPEKIDSTDIEDITSSINDLWVQSKGSGEPKQSTKSTLDRALISVFPEMRPNPRENPLNLILPAYETLWRVVLSCLIEIAFRPGAEPGWISELQWFHDQVSKEKFDKLTSEIHAGPASVASIVNEALRLYPSTKSVYRQFKMDNRDREEIVVAGIEGCHRKIEVWGQNAESFVPSRWNNIGDAAKQAFMPFGRAPFLCPAKSDYGPMIIALLVGTLSSTLSPENWSLKLYRDGETDGHELGQHEVLVSDRKTYDRLELSRKTDGHELARGEALESDREAYGKRGLIHMPVLLWALICKWIGWFAGFFVRDNRVRNG